MDTNSSSYMENFTNNRKCTVGKEHPLNFPVYFFTGGNIDYANGDMDFSLSEVEMIDVELSSSDDEASLSEFDLVKIDEYEIKTIKPAENTITEEEVQLKASNMKQEHNKCSFSRGTKSTRELDSIIAQWKPILECLVCNGLCSSFTQLLQHYCQLHPTKVCHIKCCEIRLARRCDILDHLQFLHGQQDSKKHSNYVETNFHTSELDTFIQSFIPSMKCDHCGDDFPTFGSLRKHFLRHHPTDEPYFFCCQRKWTLQHSIVEHLSVHLDNNTFKCTYCEKIHLSKFDLDRHTLKPEMRTFAYSWDSKDAYLLPITVGKNRTRVRKSNADLDAYIANWRQKLVCPTCFAVCRSYTSMETHFTDKHPNEQCFILCCQREFKTRNQLEEHINLHIDPLSYMCKLCHKWYNSRSSLYSHMCLQHPLPFSSVDDDVDNILLSASRRNLRQPRPSKRIDELLAQCNIKVDCAECSKTFVTYTLLKRHYYCCHPNKDCLFSCCQHQFNSQSGIVHHLMAHKSRLAASQNAEIEDIKLKANKQQLDELVSLWRPSLECAKCHKTYPKFTMLKRHFREEHPSTICYVNCCKKKITQRYIIDHARYHRDPKAFQCKLCGKCLPSRKGLGVHMGLKHTDE